MSKFIPAPGSVLGSRHYKGVPPENADTATRRRYVTRAEADFWLVLDQGYRIRPHGSLRGSTLVIWESVPHWNTLWMITDNGGELVVEKVNVPGSARDIPTTAHRIPLDGGTLAYRVAMVIQGELLDYRIDLADLADTLRDAAHTLKEA